MKRRNVKIKIAISTNGDHVSAHFGRCPSFTIVNVENNQKISKNVIDNPGHHPGFSPEFLNMEGISCIIADGMGASAKELFNFFGINTIMGVSGNINDIINQVFKKTLTAGENFCKPGDERGYGLDRTGPCYEKKH